MVCTIYSYNPPQVLKVNESAVNTVNVLSHLLAVNGPVVLTQHVGIAEAL